MQLKIFRHLWGVKRPMEESFPEFQKLGYVGIHTNLPPKKERALFKSLLKKYRSEYIGMIFTRGNTVREHLKSFREDLVEIKPFKPEMVVAHSGRDRFEESKSVEFFREALNIEKEIGIPIAHETHRGRILYNPWIASKLLSRFENLKLCCDFSHWVCVCERLLEGEEDIIKQCAERCIHIHARVGFAEGPQVPDPRAPEYAWHLKKHENWWKLIWKIQQAKKIKVTSLTPEFGPPRYMHSIPYTDVPLANLWDICNWMAERERQQFKRFLKNNF